MADVVIAPAKLTLSLRITGVRADGYHLIDAEMVALDLHDVVIITPTAGAPTADTPAKGAPRATGLSVSGPYVDGVPTDHSNLALEGAGPRRPLGPRAHRQADPPRRRTRRWLC